MSVIEYRKRRYAKCLQGWIWKINSPYMTQLDWRLIYGTCLIAHSVFGYMPQEWNDRLQAIANDAKSVSRARVLPTLSALLEEI